jgi:hypothetical protein
MAFGAISMVAVQHAPQLVSFRDTETPTASADKFDYVATVNPPTAKAVAASLHLSNAAPRTRIRTQGFRPKPVQSRVAPSANRVLRPTEEARKPIEKRNPAIVNAAMTDSTPSFVYLVTQSQQFDNFGNLTVTTSVWRIRVARPAPAQAQSGVIPHST